MVEQGGRFIDPTQEGERGKGRGVGGKRQGIGPGKYCSCPECDYQEDKVVNVPCATKTCPKCGASLVGKD